MFILTAKSLHEEEQVSICEDISKLKEFCMSLSQKHQLKTRMDWKKYCNLNKYGVLSSWKPHVDENMAIEICKEILIVFGISLNVSSKDSKDCPVKNISPIDLFRQKHGHMTQEQAEQYFIKNCKICPFCGSYLIREVKQKEFLNDIGFAYKRCNVCNKEWGEEYRVVAIIDAPSSFEGEAIVHQNKKLFK